LINFVDPTNVANRYAKPPVPKEQVLRLLAAQYKEQLKRSPMQEIQKH